METLEVILSSGGHANSLGRAGEVLQLVRSNPERTGELFRCIYSEDAWVRMRAIDTFEKLVRENPVLAEPYIDAIFDDLTKINQASIQWHVAELFVELDLTEPQNKKAIKWLKDKISTSDVDWIVSVNTMRALLHFCDKKLVNKDELMFLFKVQIGHKSKAVRKKATKFLEALA